MIRAKGPHTTATTGLMSVLRATGLAGALPARAKAALARLVSRLDAYHETRVLLLGPDLMLR